MRLIVYDAEIKHAIPDGKRMVEGIRYCNGWTDHEGMGVSVICAYDWGNGYRVFLEDNFQDFKALVEAPSTILIGYNNRAFDDPLLEHALRIYIPPTHSYDLLREVRIARGLHPAAVGGPNLDTLCKANFLPGKSGSGALAPILWQQGKHGQVVDYCLNDVLQLKELIELVLVGRLRDSGNGRRLAINTDLLQPFAQSEFA